MSADNGIYILRTNRDRKDTEDENKNIIGLGFYEYRVAYASAIDNIFYYKDGSQEYFAKLVSYFGECKIFYNENEAWLYAKEVYKQEDVLEYGVSQIYLDIVFPNITKEEALLILDKHDSKHFRKEGNTYINLFNQKDCEVCGHNE